MWRNVATYCFRCTNCGATGSFASREVPEWCGYCETASVIRDYRAENVGVAVVGLQREREVGGSEAMKRLFLPHNDDFKGPGDPDGVKGMREWRENNQPAGSNKRPHWPGDVEKKVM